MKKLGLEKTNFSMTSYGTRMDSISWLRDFNFDGYKLNPTSSRYSVSSNYQLLGQTAILKRLLGKTYLMREKLFIQCQSWLQSCPFKCTFCASHAAHGRAMRYHSVDRVLSDVRRMIKDFNITGVVIQDDHFMAGKRRPYEIVGNWANSAKKCFFKTLLRYMHWIQNF